MWDSQPEHLLRAFVSAHASHSVGVGALRADVPKQKKTKQNKKLRQRCMVFADLTLEVT